MSTNYPRYNIRCRVTSGELIFTVVRPCIFMDGLRISGKKNIRLFRPIQWSPVKPSFRTRTHRVANGSTLVSLHTQQSYLLIMRNGLHSMRHLAPGVARYSCFIFYYRQYSLTDSWSIRRSINYMCVQTTSCRKCHAAQSSARMFPKVAASPVLLRDGVTVLVKIHVSSSQPCSQLEFETLRSRGGPLAL